MFFRVVEHRQWKEPEIVSHGKSCFVVDSFDRIAEAVQAIHLIEPSHCRSQAKEHFSIPSMARKYADLYQRIVNERVLCPKMVLSHIA